MTVTNMMPRHVLPVARLEKQCFSDPWSEKSIASELENELALWLVAEEAGEVLGYVGSQTVMGESDMMNIAVHPDFRRRGVAGRLLEELLAALAKQGSKSLSLEVRASNEAARGLYESFGFQQVGLRKNYYRNPREDALILRKEWEL